MGLAHGDVAVVLVQPGPQPGAAPVAGAVVHLAVHLPPERASAFLPAAREASAADAVIVLCPPPHTHTHRGQHREAPRGPGDRRGLQPPPPTHPPAPSQALRGLESRFAAPPRPRSPLYPPLASSAIAAAPGTDRGPAAARRDVTRMRVHPAAPPPTTL